jgi:hypothetical protein
MGVGHVYILLNASMPGLLKIGSTERTPEDRAGELSQGTGVPSPYIVAYSEEVPDCQAAEGLIHARLDTFRTNPRREFFQLPLRDAIIELMQIVREAHRPTTGLPVDIELIRQRALDASDSLCYAMHTIVGSALVEQLGGGCVKLEVPFDALGLWDRSYLVALIPEIHEDARHNAKFFSESRMYIFMLLNEVKRLRQLPWPKRRREDLLIWEKHRVGVWVEDIRQRVYRSTEGQVSGPYSKFPVSGSAPVGDIGGRTYAGNIEFPFEAIAIGGPTIKKYDDHVLALVPKAHCNAEGNAEFFANSRADMLALLKEIERLCEFM